MAEPGITVCLLDGPAAAEYAAEFQELHAQVRAEPPFAHGDAGGSRSGSEYSAASPASSSPRPATAATWSVTRPECRCARPPPGGGT